MAAIITYVWDGILIYLVLNSNILLVNKSQRETELTAFIEA